MGTPTIIGITLVNVVLEEVKTYAWCSFGLSKNQPFCDGAHKPTDFALKVLKAEQTKIFN